MVCRGPLLAPHSPQIDQTHDLRGRQPEEAIHIGGERHFDQVLEYPLCITHRTASYASVLDTG